VAYCGLMDTTKILLGTYLFGDLTPVAAEEITRVSRRLAFAKGEAVFRAGDPATAAYVVTAGQFSESWASPDGEQYIYEVYGPCDVFGEPGIFAPERDRIVDITALEPAEVLAISRDDVIASMSRHRAVMLKMLEGLAADTRAQTILVGLGSFRPISERLIGKLLDLAGLHGSPAGGHTRINLKVSQATLAAMIGASRENVNRALAELATQHLIDTRAGQLIILDPARLRALAQAHADVNRLRRRNRLPGADITGTTAAGQS
jgi:CRP/FNR family transcriptional regulator, dissimilatory nitrate respiration regulator